MSIIGQNILAGASGGGAYTIDQSLRFNNADQPYLNKTGLSSGSTTKGTQSLWFKRGDTGRDQRLLGTWEGSNSTRTQTGWQAADKLYIQSGDSAIRISTQVFRDVSAWYHLVMAWDSTQAAASDRLHVYINGEEITAWDTNTTIAEDSDIRCNNGEISIGRRVSSAYYWFQGFIAELYWIDGTQYAASDFGETDLLTNQWIPKDASTLTFGTNGFYQKYAGDMGGDTQLLLHCDGANSGTTFTDSSQAARTVTPDNVTTNTTTKKFGTASAYFPGSGENALSIPDSSAWDITWDSSWTWEFWMNAVVPPENYAGVIVHHTTGSASPGWGIVFNNASYLMLVNLVSHASWAVKSSSVIANGGWHHYAFVHDNDANSIKLYIDGALDATGNTATISLTNVTAPLIIGWHNETDARQFEGYLDEIRFSTTARYTAPFTVATAPFGDTTIGADSSGNDNTFTVNNISITDQVLDSPTNNFCTLTGELLISWGTRSYSEGNLKFTSGSGDWNACAGSWSVNSGKWYWEEYQGTSGANQMGIVSTNNVSWFGSQVANPQESKSILYYGTDGQKRIDGSFSAYGDTYTAGDIIGVALDLDSGTQTVTFYKNNVSQGAITLTGGCAEAGVRIVPGSVLNGSVYVVDNFGQDSSFAEQKISQGNSDGNGKGDFYYTPPAGYLAMCSSNLSDPSILLPAENFNALAWSGNSGSRDITGVGFDPDFVWSKIQDFTYPNLWVDRVRGAPQNLISNTTSGETAGDANGEIDAFITDGFSTIDGGATNYYYNRNGYTYIAWNWKAGGSPVSNTDGSITSSVSANPTAGFSIATYTGNGSSPTTIGHGLSQAPEMIITKRRDTTGTWFVGHTDLTAWTYYVELNGAPGQASNAQVYTTDPTASVFSIGNVAAINGNTGTFVSYCFHSVEGYSRIGSYYGNVAANGTYVYTGFRPACIIIKGAAYSSDWHIFDNKRIGYNVKNYDLTPSETSAGTTDDEIDFLSNGFKIRTNAANINSGGNLLLYYAVAESPFKTTLAR